MLAREIRDPALLVAAALDVVVLVTSCLCHSFLVVAMARALMRVLEDVALAGPFAVEWLVEDCEGSYVRTSSTP